MTKLKPKENKMINSEDITIVKMVQELHETQADNMKLATQLEFMTLMCDEMADDLADTDEHGKNQLIEDYTYKVYEKVKNNK